MSNPDLGTIMDSARKWAENLPEEVLIDLRAVAHLALHGAGFQGEDNHDDDEGMKDALRRIEQEIVTESMRRAGQKMVRRINDS